MAVIVSTPFIGVPAAPPTGIGGTHAISFNVDNETDAEQSVGVFQANPFNTTKAISFNVDNETDAEQSVGVFQANPFNTTKAINFGISGSTLFEKQKIVDPLGAAGDRTGVATAISGDGTTLAIGSHVNGTGRVLIYILSGGQYVLQATLTPSNGQAAQEFGQYLSINTDGNYLVVGADAYDGTNANEGRGYVFNRVGTTWSEQQILVASDAALSDALGPCSISGVGDIIVMGASNQDTGASNAGAAYVFTRSGSTWTQVAKLLDPTPTVSGRFGINVGISRDGSTIIVGAYALGQAALGKAVVFVSPSWTTEATLIGADVVLDDEFGKWVELSANGDMALIGSYHDDVGGNANQGSAYVFNRVVTTWSETQKLSASNGSLNDTFGGNLDVNDAGDKVMISSSGYDDNTGIVDAGTVYVFELSGSWAETRQLVPSDPITSKFFGTGVNVTSDFSTLVVGAAGDTITALTNYGSVYIFE